jgi:hypothetical protein
MEQPVSGQINGVEQSESDQTASKVRWLASSGLMNMKKECRMRKYSYSRLSVGVWSVLLLAALFVGGTATHGQTAQAAAPQGQSKGMMTVDEGHAAAMMAERQQMMAAMHAMDQKLKDLVAQMDAATGTKKADAIAAVVKELVTERTNMSGRMMMMQDGMMQHMMQHMMSMQGGMMSMMNRGDQSSAMPSLENCPVMKGLAQEGAGGSSQKK